MNLQKLKEELVDRCGALPESAKILFDTAALRLIARKKGISEVHQEDGSILFYFKPDVKLSEKSVNILTSQPKTILNLIPGNNIGIRFNLLKDENVLDGLGRFLRLVFSEKIENNLTARP